MPTQAPDRQRVALVSGAGAGIGQAAALRLAHDGMAVVTADRDASAAAATAGQIEEAGGLALAVTANGGSSDDWQRALQLTAETFGGLDVLFNNVGINRVGSAPELSEKHWNLVLQVNLTSVFLGAKYAVPLMRQRGSGVIINNASVEGLFGDARNVAYTTSKAGIVNLTRSLAIDHARDHVRVNCLCPGVIATQFASIAFADDGTRAALEAATPLGRFGRPEEIAGVVSFLASRDASYMTGAVVVVDGGLTIGSGLQIAWQ